MASMQPAAPLQFPNLMSSSGPYLPQPQPTTPVHQEKVAKPSPQTQSDSCLPKEPARQVPRLRAVVESQAFKNILVDEMDMMVSRAATVIQANWKGYQLRQKLISQMTAAKAIQEAWRRFSTRRLMRSNKLTVRKSKREEEGDIPYHPPQQVRFHAPEDQPPVMVSKETQFPSSDNLVPSHSTAAPGPWASGVPRGGLMPQQSVTGRFTSPKYPPCMLTKSVRSSCLIGHLEGDSVKSRHVASKTIKSAASRRYGQAIHGTLKIQTQVHTEADVPKAPLHIYPVNKTPTKVCPVASTPKALATVATAPKGPLQACSTSPATVMMMQSPTCPTSPVTRPLAHVRPNPSFSSATPQGRSVVPMARAQPPGSGVTSTVKASPRLGVPVNKGPLQTGSGPVMAKTSPQMRSVTRSQPQTCAASSSSKAASQLNPTVKPSPQTRLAAMITKTPAQIRSVAAVLRALCLVPTVTASSPKGSPQSPVVAGISNAPSQVHLSSPKAKVTVSIKQTTAVVKVTSQAYLAEGKGMCGPHGHMGTVAPKLPAKSPLEVEKMKPGPPRAPKKEAAPKTNVAIVTRALSWSKVAEDRSRPLTQTQQKAEVVKVHSRVYMPEEMTVTLSQAQLAVPLTKAAFQAQLLPGHPRPLLASPLFKAVLQSRLSSGLATGLPEGQRPSIGPSAALSSSPLAAHLMSLTTQLQPAGEQNRSTSRPPLATSCPATGSPQARSLGLTFVPPEGYPNTCPPASTSQYFHPMRNSSRPPPPTEHAKATNTNITKATCQVCPSSKLSKAPSLAQLITCLAKVPSQAHLPMGLTKTQSQAQLASETAKCLLAAHPATDLSNKTQSQPLLSTSKPPVQFWQHFGTLNPGPRAKLDDESMTQPQLQSHTQDKAMQNPHSVATDTQGMLVPLLTPSGHPVCNAESWGDSGQAQTPPPPPMPSQAVSCHEDLAASIASLCADLVTMLGSTEDLRTLLVKTFSQGEVRTALSQALSRKALGPSVVKALPQGMLGMALMKALSWGELGISLSRALSRGELRPELSKATQGKLAEVLCKALTEDERAALSQALCQGELGAVFTQSLAQMIQRTGTFLPKATSKTVGGRMTTAPAPVEVTCSGSLSVAWGPALGPVGARCSKVRLLWKGLPWGQHDGILWGEGDGTTLEGSPCLPQSPVGSFSGGLITSTYQCPLLKVSTLSPERDLGYSSGLYLRPLDLDPMACGEGPHVPKQPSQQPPLCPWQPLVANGAGPSSNQPSVASSATPSSHQPPVASRVSYPWASYRQGSVVASKNSSGVGGGKHPKSQWLPTACQGSECQCPNLGTHKMSPCGHCSCRVKSHSPSPRQTVRQAPPSGHRLVSPLGHKKMVTVVRNIMDEDTDAVNSKSQNVSSTSTPKQESYPQVSLTPSCPQGQATFPQQPQMVLAKSYPRGSAAHCRNSSDSHSSLQSGASGSPSSPSSLTPSEVLEGCREGDLQEGPQSVLKESREARHKPQGQLERTWPVSSQHTVRPSQRPPLELGSLLFHSTSLALNVHWDSDSGSDYSTRDLMEALSWDTTAPWDRNRQVHTGDLQPNGVTRLDPTLPQDILADGRAPSPGPAPEASEGLPCLSQPLEATGLCPSSSQPAESSSVSPSLAQASMDTGVAPSLNHPSVAAKVFPTLAQPSMDPGVSPTLREPLIYYGLPTNFSQPFLYCGGSPVYTQQHMASGVPSNFTQTSGTSVVALGNQAVNSGVTSSHIAPSVTQSPVNSWPPPESSSMPIQGAGSPNSVQTSVATGVSPNFSQPFMPYSMPSNFTQPCLATIETPNLVQPSMSHSVSPSLAQPFVVSVMSPTLTHASVSNRASPTLRQPTTASGLVSGVLQVPLSNRVPPSLSSPLLAPRLCSNLAQTSVAALGALSLLAPTVVCGVGRGNKKSALGPWRHAHEDSSAAQSQPSTPYPCVSRLGQPFLGVCDSSGDKLVIDIRGQDSTQDATVHSELTQASKGPLGPVAQPMAPAEDGDLALGASVPCQTWLRGIAPGTPQGPVATGLFLSMCQRDNPTPVAVVTTGVGQGPCSAVMPSMQVPSEFFPNQLGTSFPQLLSMATVVSPSCRYAGVVLPDAAVGGGLVQGSVDGNVPLALVPKPVVESEALSLPQGSVIRGIGKSVPSESMVDGVVRSVPPESMVCVKAQNLSLESVVSGEIRRPYQDTMAGDVALSLPPGSVVTGVAPSHPQETSGSKEKLSPAAESLPTSHSPGSVANGAGPSMFLGSVAPPSMLVGISPRPYQAAQAGEGSWVPFLAPHVTSLASVPEVQSVAQDQQHLPTVLLSASQFSQDPGLTKLVGVDNPTLPKLRQVDDTMFSTLESGIDPVKSEGLKIISRTGLGTTGGESHEVAALAAENVLKDQVALSKEAASQAIGITPVPVQAPSLGEHPKANGITSVQPLSSESSGAPPSMHPASGHPRLQEAPVVGSSSLPPASNAIPAPPQLSSSIAGTAKRPPESEVSAGDPSILQSSGGTNLAPPTKNRASGVCHMGEPLHHTAARTSSRSNQGSLVSELLEGSMGRLLPFSSPLKPASQLSSESHKQSSGSPTVVTTPITHVGDGRGQKAPSGVQGMSPNGSRRPLLDEAAYDTIHSVQPGTGLTLTTHSGQRSTFVTGPGVGYDGGSRIPTAPHGYKYHVTVPKTSFDEGPRKVPTVLYGHRLQYITMPKTSLDGRSQVRTTAHSQTPHDTAGLQTGFGQVSHAYTTPHGHKSHLVTHPKTGHNKVSPPLTVPQGPVDAGLAAGQSWNAKVPNVTVRAAASAGASRGPWRPSKGHRPQDPSGAEAALDHEPSAELVSIRAMEKVVLQAVVTIQACARGYLVRRTVKVWHQWATIIQATWRGYCVRRNLARLLRATTIIQAAWRGYCARRDRAHQVLLPTTWPDHSARAQRTSDTRNSSEHRCFLSCQPDVCSVCQSLGPRVESPPSVVMLVGSQPRTCHVCGHTLSTRVVQGFGQGISGQSGSRWAPQQCPPLSQQHRAATLIQAAWKGYRTRRQLSQQQSAAKMVQATWRGHYTRSCLTTDALLGTGGPWNISREPSCRTSRAYSLHWPGV